MDIEMSSSCSADHFRQCMLQKDYKTAKRVLKKEGHFEGSFEDAWKWILSKYSALEMKLVPVTGRVEPDRQYLVRIGSVVFVSAVYSVLSKPMFSHEHNWIPVDKADEILEIRLSKHA